MSEEVSESKFDISLQKKGYRMQMYKKDWEREEWAEGWLTSGETPMKGHCLWCEKDLASGKSELLKHAISQKHMKKMQAYCSTLPDQHPFQTAKPGGDGQDQTLAVREPLDPDVSANQEAALVKAENQNYSPRKRTNNNDVDVVEDFDQPANENQPEKKKRRRTKKKMFEYQEVARKPMADDYEYYQLVTYDIHGNQKGQMIAKRRLDGVKKNGLGIYTAVNYFGIQDTPNVHPDFGERQHFGNLSMKPVMATLTPSIRSAGGGGRVGHVICDIELMDGTLDLTSPRAVCQNQIAKLAELQPEIRIKSASEVEFDVRLDDEYGGKDFGHTANWCSINILEENQSLILELLDELKEVKVAVDSFQTEAGPGQFEATIDVTEGIKGPDSTLRFKNATKTFFRKRGLFATYMTKPDPEKVASGMHFNHSLWTKTGRSVFQDGDNPHCLSIYGQQWLAGLITHGPALAALCCPTVNCYRRIGKPWAPTFSNWGEQDRTATFRLKVEDKGQNVYVENRLPSSASNPHLVMAATIAAGLDGITRQLVLPPPGLQNAPLPRDLESALMALEADQLLVDALGPAFVKHFVYCKKEFEVDLFGNWREDVETHRREYDMYFHKS